MKASKLDLLLADLQSERKWTESCAQRIIDVHEAHSILATRIELLDELIGRLISDSEPVTENKLTRTRKPRKAGLPEVSK